MTTAMPKMISPSEASRMVKEQRAQVIDVREIDEYKVEHVPGASLVPTSALVCSSFPESCEGHSYLVLCRSGGRAGRVAKQLQDMGRSDVFAIEGGLTGWKAQGLPTVANASAPMPLMRQVMIVAGSMVAGFTALGVWVNPWFLAGAGFVGFGLAFAGVTGICAMASILGAMPWNQRSTAKAAPAKTSCCSGSSAKSSCCS